MFSDVADGEAIISCGLAGGAFEDDTLDKIVNALALEKAAASFVVCFDSFACFLAGVGIVLLFGRCVYLFYFINFFLASKTQSVGLLIPEQTLECENKTFRFVDVGTRTCKQTDKPTHTGTNMYSHIYQLII